MKTVKFKKPTYIGDPINAVRIFNEKEVDELVFLDISASLARRPPNFALLADIASEAFMPFGYGGGITNLDEIKRLYALGVEKVIMNTSVHADPALVAAAAELAGSQSVVISMDVRQTWRGSYVVYTRGGTLDTKRSAVEYAREMEQRGAGEILLNSIDRDGVMAGYDLDLVGAVASAVSIPVVAVGGAGTIQHFKEAVGRGASAVSAGSMFVFHGRHKAVLITYPAYEEFERLFSS